MILLLLRKTAIHDFMYIDLMRPGPLMATVKTKAHCCSFLEKVITYMRNTLYDVIKGTNQYLMYKYL